MANITWEKRYTRSNNAKLFYSLKDSILCYRKSDALSVLKETRTEKADSNYANPDNDPRGDWMSASYVNPAAKDKRPNLVYEVISPDGRVITHPTHAWKYKKEEYLRHKDENRLWWGADGTAIYPRLKLFKSEMPGMVPVDILNYRETGTTDDGGNTLKAILGGLPFDTPKPYTLIERSIKMISDSNAIILDSFAGSGTTAHAVLNMNKADGGNRKFILVEMMGYADSITAERVKRVIQGYGEGKNAVEGTGGDFSFYDLGEPLLIGENLNEAVWPEKIREYVWFMETKTPYAPAASDNPYYLGRHNDTSYYFYYAPGRITVLDYAFLSTVTKKSGGAVIYADRCALGEDKLAQMGIVFKKIPRDIARL